MFFQKKYKKHININGDNNKIIIKTPIEKIKINSKNYHLIKGLNILINGNNNVILINKPFLFYKSKIIIECNDCVVEIGATVLLDNKNIYLNKNGASKVISGTYDVPHYSFNEYC